MRDLADALGMKQASLYYHVPDGKEQLFVEVMERNLARHRYGLTEAIETAAPNLESQLRAIAGWLISQFPLNLLSTFESDMPDLSPESAQQLMQDAYRSLFQPLIALFHTAHQRGEIRYHRPDLLAGLFLSMMDGLSYAHHAQGLTDPAEDADLLIDILMNGLRPYLAQPYANGEIKTNAA